MADDTKFCVLCLSGQHDRDEHRRELSGSAVTSESEAARDGTIGPMRDSR